MSRPLLLDLQRDYKTVIDEEDLPLVHDLTLYRGTNGYVYYSKWYDGKSHPRTLHSLLMGCHPRKHVDHINGDKLDNRRENLRIVTPFINNVNRHQLNRNNTSGVRGVGKFGDKWRVQITVNRRNRHIGLYDSLEEAARVRRVAEHVYFGEPCP